MYATPTTLAKIHPPAQLFIIPETRTKPEQKQRITPTKNPKNKTPKYLYSGVLPPLLNYLSDILQRKPSLNKNGHQPQPQACSLL